MVSDLSKVLRERDRQTEIEKERKRGRENR